MPMDILTWINSLFGLCTFIGGVIALLQSRNKGISSIKDETILALQQQVEAIKSRQDSLEKENERLKQIIETIQSALKARGVHITIDGEVVIIEESTVKRQATKIKEN
jgi:FtsZ-binding cell division protein ZapB